MQAILLRFLQTGELGPLNCNLFREDVRRLLGEPSQWDGRETFSKAWRYDALGVNFGEDHRVIGYGLGFNPGQRIPDGLGDLEGRRYVEMTMPDVHDALRVHAILVEEGNWAGNLRTTAGVWINEGRNGNLMSIVYACPGPDGVSWLDECFRRPKS